MTADTMTLPSQTSQAVTILEKSVCLLLTCGYVGNYRKVDPKHLEMKKDGTELKEEKRFTTVTKRLVDSKHLRPCESILSAAKAYMLTKSLPGHRVFGAGTYLVPVENVTAVVERLKEFQAELATAKAELAAKWDKVREESRVQQTVLFNASQFPTAEDVLSDYSIEWRYISFAAPDKLQEISPVLADLERKKWQEQLSTAYTDVIYSVRAAALKVMKEMAVRLRPGADGKPKALHPTAMRDLNNLLEQLPILNLTNDDMVADVVAAVAPFANGVTVDTLRTNESVRNALLSAAEKATEQLDELIEDFRAMDLS